MPGPAPTPFPLRVLKGNPSKRPLRRGFEPERPSEPPDCPSFLVGHAADEWHRIAAGLHRFGLLTAVDVMPLAAYCVSYARWREASEALAKMAERDPVASGLLIKSADGSPRQNPLARVAADAAGDMVRYAAEFGFSPAARARLAAGPFGQPPPGKFDGLLA